MIFVPGKPRNENKKNNVYVEEKLDDNLKLTVNTGRTGWACKNKVKEKRFKYSTINFKQIFHTLITFLSTNTWFTTFTVNESIKNKSMKPFIYAYPFKPMTPGRPGVPGKPASPEIY